jgi:hypothetical protein
MSLLGGEQVWGHMLLLLCLYVHALCPGVL